MQRIFQILLITSTVVFSWLAMQAVHEFGHVLHAWLSGGTLAKVYLHPLDISRTDFRSNPHPLFVVWGGLVWGCVIPWVFNGIMRMFKSQYTYLAAFFAGFCWIANGAYLAAGSFTKAGDAGDLLRLGSPRWLLTLTGTLGAALGLYSWNGLAPNFGLGLPKGPVDRRTAVGVSCLLIVLIFVELMVDGWQMKG